MVRLRQMAVAFLWNEEAEVLFLQKKSGSVFLPGHLVPIGGHMEEGEFNDPRRACIREIEEETGLAEQAIRNLSLRYIVHRIRGNQEIRIQYVYMGYVPAGNIVAESEEGKLLWMDGRRLSGQHLTASTKEIMNHYLEQGIHNAQIYVGSLYPQQDRPVMGWTVLEDWEDCE